MAFECIGNQTYEDAYTTAIVAYAYSLYDGNSTEAQDVYDKLMNMTTQGKPASLLIRFYFTLSLYSSFY